MEAPVLRRGGCTRVVDLNVPKSEAHSSQEPLCFGQLRRSDARDVLREI